MPITQESGYLTDTKQAIPKGYELTNEQRFKFAPGTPGGSIVSSTYDIRANEANNQNEAAKAGSEIDDMSSLLLSTLNNIGSNMNSYSDSMNDYNALRASLGSTTAEDEQSIEEAGQAAGLGFNEEIQAAEEAKRQGMPKALIGAGERGGLMNTQFAGAAALTPTEGGSWVGAGGELERVQSNYDAQINNLKAQQKQAILAAKQAQRQAIRSGKQDDLDNMYKQIQLARDLNNDANNLAMDKAKLVQNYLDQERSYNLQKQKFDEDVRQFNASEERLNRTQQLQEAKWLQDIDEATKQQTLDNITRMAESGIDINQLSDEEITTMELQAGLNPGTFEAFYQRIFNAARQGDVLDQAKVEKALADVENSKLNIEQTKLSMSRTKQLMANTARSKAEAERDKAEKAQKEEEKAMWDEVISLQDRLSSGKIDWGQAFNQFKSKWGAPDDFIDTYLDKEKWAKPGAYEQQEAARAEAKRQNEEQEQTMQDYLQGLKDQGYSKKDIKKDFKNDPDFERVPDFVKDWLDENY